MITHEGEEWSTKIPVVFGAQAAHEEFSSSFRKAYSRNNLNCSLDGVNDL